MKALLAVLALLCVFGVGYLLYSSPTGPPEMTEAEIAQIEAEVLAASDVFTDALAAMDAEIMQGLLHPTETSWVWGGRIRDFTTYPERLVTLMEPWESWEGGWTQRTVKVLAPNAAMFQGEYEATVHYQNGRVVHWPGNANVTALMERTPEGWKVTIADMDNGSAEVVEEG